jgi:aryl-alcohol dehydrogenase-like predicted oxidoreductase
MRYRLLGSAGLRVSEVCLGTMTFGDDWGWGADEAMSRKIFEIFAEAGGTFIDTSNNYTNGTSERLVGEFTKSERDRFVIATKYSLRLLTGNARDANLGGNSRKSMIRSVENSLRRMGTEYIDLLYLHMWDFTTPVPEVLQAALDLISSGKVMYFAFSDTPAWVVSYAIAKAEFHGWPSPVALQVPYSLLDRSVERAELPMARAHDLAILAWGLLEGGILSGKYSQPAEEPRRESRVGERALEAGNKVAQIAEELGCTPAQVAIRWVKQQPGNVIPILGCRTENQLLENLGFLEVELSEEHMAALSAIADFKPGFPNDFLHSDHVRGLIFGDTYAKLDNRGRKV